MGPEALKELRTILNTARGIGSASHAAHLDAKEKFVGHGPAMLDRLEELEGVKYRKTPGHRGVCLPDQHAFEAISDPYAGLHAPEDDSRFGWRQRLFCTKCGATMEIPCENPHPDEVG